MFISRLNDGARQWHAVARRDITVPFVKPQNARRWRSGENGAAASLP
jgi:hypothetical protein